jgi:hypothetical protein
VIPELHRNREALVSHKGAERGYDAVLGLMDAVPCAAHIYIIQAMILLRDPEGHHVQRHEHEQARQDQQYALDCEKLANGSHLVLFSSPDVS